MNTIQTIKGILIPIEQIQEIHPDDDGFLVFTSRGHHKVSKAEMTKLLPSKRKTKTVEK